MNKMDIYYGALTDYRKSTRENNDCIRQRKYISRANAEEDRIEVVTTECEIDEDWIIAIEKGLEFVDKAIKEERQFILSNGEVVPVEKVKNVSKESVEHLAKHSNLLTRLPKEGEDLIPDQLYTVERLTDFAVYENRFLYMLLCYLRDFISLRYNSIVELVTTYNGKMTLHKTISVGDRKSVVQINLDEHLKNDKYLREHNSSKEKIDRIDGLLKAVVAFLAHPLMEEVSKAPMLKPPITETNVLKMNKNFKGAMQLYYFVTAYSKRGYDYHTETRTLNPFKEHVADDIAEVVELCSFLTYEHGMGIEGDLKANHEELLKRQREEEQQRKLEQLKALRKRIKEHGGDPEEYMLLLEQRNRLLEADSVQLARAKNEIKQLTEKIVALQEEVQALQTELADVKAQLIAKEKELAETIERYEQRIVELNEKHAAEILALNEAHEAELAALKEEYESAIRALKEEHAAAIAALERAHAQEVASLNEAHERAIAEQKAAYEGQIAEINAGLQARLDSYKADCESKLTAARTDCESRIARVTDEFEVKAAKMRVELGDSQEALVKVRAELEKVSASQAIIAAKYNALKKQTGRYEGNEDFTSQEGFGELERQYNHFKALFKEQWKKTKKGIRKEYLRVPPTPPKAETPTETKQNEDK